MPHTPSELADAIGRLYEETGFLVLRRCVRVLGSTQEALDVTQWTYLRAFEVGFQVRSRGEALAWLYLTATKRCLWLLRNEATRRRIRAAHPNLGALAASSPEARAVDRDLVERALRGVDERVAEIALLTFVQGFSAERAAEITGTSVRTVSRARASFEAELRRLVEERAPS